MTIYTDAGTISSGTTVSANERGPFHESATINSTTSITVGEYSYTHPAGSWGTFDTDDGII